MKIEKTSDEVTRSIRLSVDGAEPMEKGTLRPRRFQPDRVDIKVGPNFTTVEVSGYLALKSGELSDITRVSIYWYGLHRLAVDAPLWLVDAVHNTITGEIK